MEDDQETEQVVIDYVNTQGPAVSTHDLTEERTNNMFTVLPFVFNKLNTRYITLLQHLHKVQC